MRNVMSTNLAIFSVGVGKVCRLLNKCNPSKSDLTSFLNLMHSILVWNSLICYTKLLGWGLQRILLHNFDVNEYEKECERLTLAG